MDLRSGCIGRQRVTTLPGRGQLDLSPAGSLQLGRVPWCTRVGCTARAGRVVIAERPEGAGNGGADSKPTEWMAANTPEAWGERARSGGADHVIADWGSVASHELRLHALLRLPWRPGDVLLDLACGTGRLADFAPEGLTYEGLDWSLDVIEVARRRRPGIRFRQGTETDLTGADWVVTNGLFNMEDGWTKARTKDTVVKMWRASRRGIAVTARRERAEGRLHYSPEELQGFLTDLDWSELELDRSYLPNDICLRAWRSPDPQ